VRGKNEELRYIKYKTCSKKVSRGIPEEYRSWVLFFGMSCPCATVGPFWRSNISIGFADDLALIVTASAPLIGSEPFCGLGKAYIQEELNKAEEELRAKHWQRLG